MPKPLRAEGERVFTASVLLGLGYSDNIAARTLIRCGMLLQGATLAARANRYWLDLFSFRGEDQNVICFECRRM